MKMSAVIGHRGAAEIAPENTLAGIRAAHECGVTWVEMDVVLLGDGSLVMHHDRTLNRCTSGKGELLSLTLDEVKSIEAGVLFGDRFRGEHVPTLMEALDLIDSLGMGINLEIKMHKHTPEALVTPVLRAIDRHPLIEKSKMLISSFDHEVLKLCCEQRPDLPVGHLFEALPDNWLELTREVKAVSVHPNQKLLHKPQATSVVQNGYALYCYTVNSEKRASELMSWGVTGVITDRPEEIQKALF